MDPINHQLSTTNYQPPTINHQLSTIILTSLLITLASFPSFAQENLEAPVLDSLSRVLENTDEDSLRLHILTEMAEQSLQLSRSKREKGEQKIAFEYLRKYDLLRDSLLHLEKNLHIERMKEKYDHKKKALKIQKLNREEELEEASLKRKRILTYSISGGTGGVLVLALFLLFRWRNKKKANRILSHKQTVITRQQEEIEEKNKDITSSIQYAKRIQDTILPTSDFMQETLPEHFVLFRPKDIVSGDFYWMEDSPSNDKTLFSVIDCTGHGVPGALVSIMGYNALDQVVKESGIHSPALALNELNTLILKGFDHNDQQEQKVRDGMDLALCTWDRKTQTLQYAGANNPLYLITPKGSKKEFLESTPDTKVLTSESEELQLIEVPPTKQPIGSFENIGEFTQHDIPLEKGDTLYLFSDGFADQFGGPKQKKFKYKPFKRLLLDHQHLTMAEQRNFLERTLEEWRGDLQQTDDVCVMGIRI